MENGAGIPSRIAELEQVVSELAYIVASVVPLLGAVNSTVARLADETVGTDAYQQRCEALEADIARLLKRITDAWPPR